MMKRHTVTLTSTGQLTVPVALCRALGLQPGTKLDVLPLPKKEGFSASIRRPSRILDFAGDLKDVDVPPRKRGCR